MRSTDSVERVESLADRDPVAAMKQGGLLTCTDCPAQLASGDVMVFQPEDGPTKVVCQPCLVVNLTRELDAIQRRGIHRARARRARGR
jgi:hypothetical protein